MGLQDFLGDEYAFLQTGTSGLEGILNSLVSSPQRGRKMPNLPSGGGGNDIEIIYGGNRFNPTSSDASHPSHLHFALQRGIVPVGRRLQRLGFDVGEHPKFGGVAPVHTSGSHHYNRDAIDVNYNGGGRWASEQQALSWLERWLKRKYG